MRRLYSLILSLRVVPQNSSNHSAGWPIAAKLWLGLLVLLAATMHGRAQCIEVRVITWNMQSDFTSAKQESDPKHLAGQMAKKGVIDIWGLSEVLDQATLDIFQQAIEKATSLKYTAHLSKKGGRDRLAILYRADMFEPDAKSFEIDSIQVGNSGLRPGLAIKLKGKKTGQEFFFVVNHFKCCGGKEHIATRVKQAKALNAFARGTALPVIAVGDYNTPFNIFQKKTPKALKQLIKNGPFQWVKPKTLVRTEDSHANILDYILVANAVEGWSGTSTILRRDSNAAAKPGDPFNDNENDTDHRPVLAVFAMDCAERIRALKEEITLTEARLDAMRTELKNLTKKR